MDPGHHVGLGIQQNSATGYHIFVVPRPDGPGNTLIQDIVSDANFVVNPAG